MDAYRDDLHRWSAYVRDAILEPAIGRDILSLAPLRKFAVRAARRRSSPPKLVTLSNALLAVADPQGIPDPATEGARFGAWGVRGRSRSRPVRFARRT